MQRFFLIAAFLISICAFSQTNDISWYQTLKGKIDKYPVTLHLHKAAHKYVGYYYNSQQKPVYIFGDDTTVKGKIQLFSNAEPSEYFIFSLEENSATGTWKKTEKSKPLFFAATKTTLPVRFTYVFASGLVKLRPKWKDSPEATYNAASVWPNGKTATDEFLKKEIRHAFDEKNTGEEIGALLLRNKKDILNRYVSDSKGLQDSDLKRETMMYSMEEDDEMLIAFQSSKILSLAFSNYTFTGGAHGNYGTSYLSIDLTSNKNLTLDNIITEKGKKILRGMLEKIFRKQFNLKPTDSLSEAGLIENKIEPNENFYVTGKGIGFSYNPDEISPYVMGEINIFIPFTDLKNFLKKDFKKLID